MLHLKESCRTKELMLYRAHLKAYRRYVLAHRPHLMGSKTPLMSGILYFYFDDRYGAYQVPGMSFLMMYTFFDMRCLAVLF